MLEFQFVRDEEPYRRRSTSSDKLKGEMLEMRRCWRCCGRGGCYDGGGASDRVQRLLDFGYVCCLGRVKTGRVKFLELVGSIRTGGGSPEVRIRRTTERRARRSR